MTNLLVNLAGLKVHSQLCRLSGVKQQSLLHKIASQNHAQCLLLHRGQVLQWFNEEQEINDLRVCRIKNKFSLPRCTRPDA